MIIDQYPPVLGGAEKQAHTVARASREFGVTMEVVTGRLERTWRKHEVLDGVPITRIPFPRVQRVGVLVFWVSLFVFLLRRGRRFDIFHIHVAGGHAAVAILFGKLLRKKAILKIAGSGEFGEVHRYRATPLAGLVFAGIRYADRVIVISHEVEKELLSIGCSRERIVRIPNGVDLQVFRPAAPGERESMKRRLGLRPGPNVLFVGRLGPEKGLHTLLTAWQYVQCEFRGSSYLLLVGSGPQEGELRTLACEYGLERSVMFLGACDNPSEYYRAADLFVLPSVSEGLSNSLLEAMACGLPVIASRVGGNPEVICPEENGLLVPSGDWRALGQAILRLLEEKSLARRLGQNGVQTVTERYAITAVCQAYIELYEQLLS